MSILDEEGQRQQVQPRFLDLSGVHISTKEELQNIMLRMLEVRLRPDKLSEDEINRIIYCESSSPSADYPFLDPIPPSMREVDLSALSQVDIDWKMLTLARPNTKQEMEIFTRFVELEKLKMKSLCQEDEKAETRVTAIKPKVLADGFEQEINTDEFTYDYFSRRLAVEEMPPSEDSKKPSEAEKRKLSQKFDSVVSRQETFPEQVESPSPIPDLEPETGRKLSAKKKVKKLRRKKVKRRKRKKRRRRRIRRLRNGRVVFLTVKRRKKWYTLKKKKRKGKGRKEVSASKESEGKPSELESTTGKRETVDGNILSETKDDLPSETRESSARSRKSGRRKKSAKVSMSKKASSAGEKGVKAKKHNLSNASKTDIRAPKLATTGRRKSTSKHVKGAASRVLAKRGTFTRSASIRLTKTLKVARLKIKQTARARKESTKAKLDADAEGIELDEIAKEGCATEEDDSSAKLSSSESGTTKMNVKNRRSFKTLIKANMESKRTADSPTEKPSQDEKENNKNLPK